MNKECYTEAELQKGCIAGNAKIQEYLYRQYYAEYYKVCLRYVNQEQDASTVLNEAFYKIFSKAAQYNQQGAFGGWMRRIVVNTCLDKLRAQTRQYEKEISLDDRDASVESETPADALQHLQFKELMQLIQQLPPTHKVVFNLHVFEGMNHQEIAEIIGIKRGTSQWYLSKAKEILRTQILTLQQLA